MKKFIRQIDKNARLFRDARNGLAWIEDGTTGMGISIHPNISDTGSVRGMKEQGYWKKHDRTVRSHGFIYNIDHVSFSWDMDERNRMSRLERIVADECRCIACVERREKNKEEHI